jgi:HD-GYP domain-containing protein (c-di-GMP phosphodiesterase class II)
MMLARYTIVDEVKKKAAELTQALALLTQLYDDTVEALGSALALRDMETKGHSQRVTAFCISIARAMPVPDAHLPMIGRAAFLHDVGKIAIPDSILFNPGPLHDSDKQIMRAHCEIGYNLLNGIPFLRAAADIVLAHHEFFDGTGYPRGLRGEQIPLGARILSIADALDVMLSGCRYHNAVPLSHAREEIWRCAGTQFDPKIVQVFLTIAENHWVELREKLKEKPNQPPEPGTLPIM